MVGGRAGTGSISHTRAGCPCLRAAWVGGHAVARATRPPLNGWLCVYARARRGKLLDDTEGALVDSTANAQSVAAKAKERYHAARGSFCWTCLMLLAVAAVFAAMMVYIKVTAMVGITGRRAPPKRARGGGGSGGGSGAMLAWG